MTAAGDQHRTRVAPVASSGIAALDDALGGLYWGDNVVLRETAAGAAAPPPPPAKSGKRPVAKR